MAQERVGKRVRVYWSEEEEWFEGTVQEYDGDQGYYVVYDDGDERWEDENQPMLVEGEEEAQTQANYEELRAEREAPEMIEPPMSPESSYDDEYEQSESQQPEGKGIVVENEEPSGFEVDEPEEKVVNCCQEGNILPGSGEPDTSDGEQSVVSEMPATFDKSSVGKRPSSFTAPVPVKGLLQGRVLRATGLQTSRTLAPNAFVRVSFVESEDTSAMLRCKETLATTAIARGSINPVWSEDLLSGDNQRSNQDGAFQLELLPRIIAPATKPAWHQLPGTVLFTVFSVSSVDGSSRHGANEHIGQATIPLRSLMQELLTTSPFTTRALELRSRSGKRLGYGNVSARSLMEERTESPALIASFKFIPTYESKTRLNVPRSLSNVAKAPSKRSVRQEKALSSKPRAPAKTSSSCINRRRFEQQIAKDNRSFAKRLEWKEARRSRQSAQAKAQEKQKVTPPQYGARKHDHKAHSNVNRTKFVQQVAIENKAIGKRLQNILNSDEGARNPENFSTWAAEPKDSSNGDYMDRDKLHAQDKRWQRQVELDFMMEKAQTKYQQHHQMVEEVMELQESVSGLKTRVETLNKSVIRLEILNKKDQHVRDCLVRAAATSGSSKVSPRQPRISSKSSKSSTEDVDSPGTNRKEKELKLLYEHRDGLQEEKVKLSHELKALNQQELEIVEEIDTQQKKWEHALATQLFHRQMDKKNVLQAQKAIQEMKRRQKALELSREEEELWACYQAHQELTQLQIAIQILRDQKEPRVVTTRASRSSVCDYLTMKITKQKAKVEQLQNETENRRRDYELMLVSGGNETLRKRVQELQKLVFLCKSQAAHVKKAKRSAQRRQEQVDLDFQRRLFKEQTETDIVLKRAQKQ
ncbi:hypothetical protein P3T76_012411 [Phytophthora citrophthora]|uniref:C2 domain-containing protein n=1 Tax=Phytophthora citrophthora TaxID=4793 RepID=A0AAD9LD34_9STRA|nr:hypothetical protein P3T76_012411 [Phytophthora citrophthora]